MAPFLTRSTGDVVAEVKMSLAAFKGVNVLVEGPTDSKFWKLQFDRNAAFQVVICGNKHVVTSSIKQLEILSLPLMLGIIDDDFDTILGIVHGSNNIFATDTHDLETMFLCSSALQVILTEYGDEVKIARFESASTKSVLDALVEMALIWGKLRLISERNKTNVDFDDFSPWKYVKEDTWGLDMNRLFADFGLKISTTPSDVEKLVVSEINHPIWNVIQGHDAMDILAIGIRKVLSNKQVNVKDLNSAFRLAYNKGLFVPTKLFQNVSQWATSNGASLF